MPDARDRRPAVGVGALFPVAHDWPGISPLGPRRAGSGRWNKKENVPLGGRRRRKGPKRRALPAWYPRTALRDITHIVNISARLIAVNNEFAKIMNWGNRRQQEFDNRANAGVVIRAMPLAGLMTQEPDDSEETLHLHGADSSTASDVSSVSSPSPPSLGTETCLVDIPPLPESTMGNIEGNAANNNFNLEAYEPIIKERMKIAIEMERKKKPARSHLMLMR